jgi:hypothetical protein
MVSNEKGRAREVGLKVGIPLVGWALCFALIGIGMSVTTVDNALIIHAIGAPIIFAFLASVYFRRNRLANPLTTAIAFTAFVMAMDFFVVALLILRDVAMFYSILGTWIPFALIFLSTYLTGLYTSKKTGRPL